MTRPQYQALDANGLEYMRAARVVGELPPELRTAALQEAGAVVSQITGLRQIKTLPFGAPVFTAFEGMNRAKSKHHGDCKLLLTCGGDLSLDLCPSYSQP